MAVNILNLPDFAQMVGKNLTTAIEDAVYEELKPITERIARSAAKRIANSVKGYAHYSMGPSKDNTYRVEPTILLQFNSEDVKF